MKIELIINCSRFLWLLKNGFSEEIYDVLTRLDKFSHINIFTYDSATDEIYQLLYEKRHSDIHKLISLWFDRTKFKGEDIISFNNQLYLEKFQIVNQLELLESTNFKGILLGDEEFEFGTSIAGLDDRHGIRGIKNISSLKKFLVLLTNNTKTSSEFIDILRRTLDGLEFDAEIEHSIKTLEAGFEIRKKEVLYHLFCIEREIPMILKCYKGNQEIGAHMSLPCSPERDRNLVKKKLTKKIGDTELVCELHTKLKKIGARKPDRIYFCPQVKSHIVNKNGEDITGKIYIYKIGEHL